MSYLTNYLLVIEDTFKSKNIIFFIISVIIFQIIDLYIFKLYKVQIYQIATFLSLYIFINYPLTVYKLLFSAVLATVVSYYIYQIFVYFNKTKNIITLNTLTFIITINFMILFDCFCIPALAYTMVANILIPKSKFAYLTSYIAGCIVIVIIC